MKRKKITLIPLLFMAVVGLVSAAGGKEEGTAGEAGKVTINVATWDDRFTIDEHVEAPFESAYPNIDVNYLVFPAKEYDTTLATQLAGGADIDVYGTKNNAGYADLVERGVAFAIDDLIAKDTFDLSGFGPLINGIKFNGSIYGLPVAKSAWVLYYNKDLFDANGVGYPSEDMTWEEFRNLAKKMTTGRGAGKVWGAYFHTWPVCTFGPALQDGTTIIDEDLSSVERAFELRLALEEDGSIMSYYDAVASKTHYNALFQSGKLAMNIIGNWHVAQLRRAEDEGNLNFDWDIVPMPHPKGVTPNTTWGMPDSISITAKSDNKEAAWEFLKFRTGLEGAKISAEHGTLPAFYNKEIGEVFLSGGNGTPENLEIIPQANVYVEYPAVPGINTIVNSIYKEEIELMFVGDQSPAQTISKIKKRIQEEM